MRSRTSAFVLVTVLALSVATTAVALPTAATVGRQIFTDVTLSNPPGQSCASCHDQAAGFADPDSGSPVSSGAIPERVGNRNAPTASYSSFIPPRTWDTTLGTYVGGQFWDGRADSLEEQAKGPFLNPLEMNMPSKAAVVAAVAAAPYAKEFRAVFGADSLDLDDADAAYDRIASAIAAYERTADLDRFSSKHDYAMMFTGPARMQTFTMTERQGMMLFNGTKAKCSTCHVTPMSGMGGSGMGMVPMDEIILFTDHRYANLGIPRNLENPFYALPPELNPDGAAYVDHGLAAALPGGVDANPGQDGMFKTPTLRNVAKTAPYGHNGYFPTLKSVVQFYNTRDTTPSIWPEPEVPSNLETATMGALGLTSAEEDQIVAFLGTLTDGWWLTPMDYAAPITVATVTGTVGNAGWLTSDASVQLYAVDFGGGVATIDYATGTNQLQTYLSPFPISAEGETVFRYKATDTAGNVETETAESVKIDKTPPAIESANDSATYELGAEVAAAWSASDAVSGVSAAVSENPSGTPIPTDVLGENSYTITATDVAGNSATKTVTYRVKSAATVSGMSASTAVPYGSAYAFSGQLADAQGPVAGAVVSLFSSTDGQTFVVDGRTAVTGDDGSFSFSVAPQSRTWYRVAFDGDATRFPVVSAARVAVPRISLSAPSVPAVVTGATSLTASGTFMPGHATTIRIAVYRLRGTTWVLSGYKKATVTWSEAQGSYTAAFTLGKGTWRIRAYAPGDSEHAATWSPYSAVTVK